MSFDCWEEESIPLETEWIQEFEKIVEERIYYPCEPMSSLCIYSIFIEKNTIVHVSTKQLSLEPFVSKGGYRNIWEVLDKKSKEPYWMDWIKEDTEFIGSEESLKMEKKRLEKRAKGFFLSDILLFNVDMNMGSDTEGAIDNLDYSTLGSCFHGYSIEEWDALGKVLNWKDSVFLFHSINAVYFVFQENHVMVMDMDDLVLGGVPISVEMPVSILVSGGGRCGGGGGGKTRKVHFGDSSDIDSSDMDSESSSSSEEEEEEWGKGKWLKKRKRNRRKTEKRKHVFSPALIRSLFEK
jgi:hypothetical protein